MKNRAFTMIDLLLYIGMVSIFIVALATFIGFFTQARTKSITIEEVNQQGMFITEYINQVIRDGSTISSPAKASLDSTLNIVSSKYPERSPSIINLIDGKIFISEGGGGAVQVSSDKITITDLVFFNSSQTQTNGNISYRFTVIYNNLSGRSEFNYTQTFYGGASTR